MFGLPNGMEWIIILIIVVLLFGVGRLGRIGGEMGSAIRQFREGLGGDKKDEQKLAASLEEKTDDDKTA
ncbi:MAG: twin-arginine translocase TatA/TatE family subunit [Anaerolineales bacterium]